VIYVAAMTNALRGRLATHCRLYAYPSAPEPPAAGGFVILDSGAYALSKQGRMIDKRHMAKLAEHYARHGASNARPVVGVAPDAFPFPRKSMANWQYWHKQGYPPVAPVIQFEKGRIDFLSIKPQVDFYRQWATPFVLVSNPSLRAAEAKARGMERTVAYVRKVLRVEWVHVLGAGWDKEDARLWATIAGVDSIDSVAYYTAAQAGIAWGKQGSSWQDTAVFNLEAVQ
jgi:hypothetical protein